MKNTPLVICTTVLIVFVLILLVRNQSSKLPSQSDPSELVTVDQPVGKSAGSVNQLLDRVMIEKRGLKRLFKKKRKPFIAKVQVLELDVTRLYSMANGELKEFEFDLGDQRVVGKVENVIKRSEKNFGIQGTLGTGPGDIFRLSLVDDVVFGNFQGEVGKYNLRYSGEDNIYELETLNAALMPRCAGALKGEHQVAEASKQKTEKNKVKRSRPTAPSLSASVRQANSSISAEAKLIPSEEQIPEKAALETTVLDVVFGYTTESKQFFGGTSGVLAAINMEMDDTNLALSNSGVNARVNLVGTVEVEYDAFLPASPTLSSLRDGDDGVLDEIYHLRNELHADFAHLLVTTSDVCGLAYRAIDGVPFAFNGRYAFGLTDTYCTGNFTVAHELGHNFGCSHAVGDAGETRDGGFNEYGFGWRWSNGSNQYRSVMAYSPGIRTNHFSNPSVRHLGVPTGRSNLEDNARLINENAADLALYRTTDEFGNRFSNATNATVPSLTEASFQYYDDLEFVKFEVFKRAEFRLYTTGDSDTVGELYNSMLVFETEDDDSGDGYNFSIVETLDPGVYYLRINEYSSGEGNYQLHLEGDGTDYSLWASQYAPANLSRTDADFDNDGINNLNEWAFNSDPTNPASLPIIEADKLISNRNLYYTRRRTSLTRLDFEVEMSEDLITWREPIIATDIATTGSSGDSERRRVIFSSSDLQGPKAFFRVRVK